MLAETTPRWRELLDAAVKEHGVVKVATEHLGYRNHTGLSRILKGHIEASGAFISAVMMAFDTVECPYLQKQIAITACRGHALRDAPTHDPFAMRHWRACHGCPNKHQGEPK